MAGEQKRKARAVLITKALLLGYTIERNSWVDSKGRQQSNGYRLYKPNGLPVVNTQPIGPSYVIFPVMWRAAKHALELAGVLPDAKNSR